MAALEPLARPANGDDTRSGDQRRADALTELARRALERGQLPQTAGVRPQLTVTVELDSLLGRPGRGALGGEAGGVGPLAVAACRRLACDGALTRVLVTRSPTGDLGHHDGDPGGHHDHQANGHRPSDDPHDAGDLAARLRAAMTLLPPILAGAPSQPLDVGRTTRVVTSAQRSALAVRDGGCVFPHCARPLAWCEAHHLVHWLHGGPTDLANLALLCRTHHRAVHEGAGGWPAAPMAGSPPPHPTDPTDIPRPTGDIPPRPELAASRRDLGWPQGRASPPCQVSA